MFACKCFFLSFFFLKGKFLPGGAEWRNRAVSDVEPSSLLLWPQNASGTGWGGERRALLGAPGGRIWGGLGSPAPVGARPGLWGCAGWYLRPGSGQTLRSWVGTHIFWDWGRATEDGKPHSWAGGMGVGWAGGDFS